MGLRDTFAALRGTGGPGRTGALAQAREATAAKDWPAAAQAWAEVVATAGPTAPDAEPWRELARARRLDRDLTAARQTIEEGRRRFPEDLGLSVELARLALRGYAASAEDERHIWKAMLLEAQAALREALERGEVTKPALHAAAEIELVLRRWQDARGLWAELERRYPDRADEAIVKQATASRAAGALAEARATLGRASAAARARKDAQQLARTITADEGVAEANAAFAAASSRWHAGDVGVLRIEVPEAIRLRGHSEDRANRLLPLLDDLAEFVAVAAAGREEAGPARCADTHAVGDARDTVLISGFLYSGSGAVFDLLRQYEEFHLPFADRETGFLKKPGHLATILDGPVGPDGPRIPDPGTVTDAVLASTIGFGQTGRPLLGWVGRDEPALDRFVLQLRWLVAELRRTWAQVGQDAEVSIPRAADAIGRFIDAFVADRTPVDRRALLNNAIVGHNLRHLRLASRSVAVAVLRDPRDQYVSQRLESPFAMEADDFIATMAERYRAYAALRADAELEDRLVTVAFEPFVTDPDERAALLDRLHVAAEAHASGRAFDPERSRRNIGIHAAYADQEEIARVADGLLEPYVALVHRA
ncbi:hypothetical protein [Nitriliruptor alkaliphilus]|uniref:hypothetical protein n=1 Tax=Nitriliruptor alkaliphilus TaxID=427918 RepID=UPI0006988CE9|nr:hypothetical protein [Nitriliruptor alkaliphilus]